MKCWDGDSLGRALVSNTESIFPKRSALGRFLALFTVTVNVACTILNLFSICSLFAHAECCFRPRDQPPPALFLFLPSIPISNSPGFYEAQAIPASHARSCLHNPVGLIMPGNQVEMCCSEVSAVDLKDQNARWCSTSRCGDFDVWEGSGNRQLRFTGLPQYKSRSKNRRQGRSTRGGG